MKTTIIRNIKSRKESNDKIYTPKKVAEIMIKLCDIKENETVLDPSKGGGVFYNNLPQHCIKDYCEIEEDKDFLKYNKQCDIIIGNPPYSIWNKWIDKTLQLNPQRFCYIWGIYNLTNHRIGRIIEKGYGIKKIIFLKIDWWFSSSYIVLFEKGYVSKEFINYKDRIMCENCGKRCKRGGKGYSFNKCSEL